ncbi:MAG TPA: carboxypeptidase regulatory-like domain-containing protein [Polyangiaceae bacterium]|nr:carboxypeptidase regulatory-like domain-containing protein [Polyangiaceae bacterium]
MIFLTRPIAGGLTGLFLSGALACSAGSPATSTTRGSGGGGNTSPGTLNVGGSNAGNSGLNVSVAGSGNTGSGTLTDCGSGPPTSLSGTVYDPAGAVPLYNVVLFVPGEALSPITTGAACQTCDGDFSGKPQAVALSDSAGHFEIDNVPAGDNIPLVIQVGKWRREVTIAHVNACMDNAIMDKDMTRLPRNQTEGNIPHIAVALGGSDSLECLLRRIGVDDSEFTPPDQGGRVHLYRWGDNAATTMQVNGASSPVPTADTLWGNLDALMAYDLMLLSCTGESKLGTETVDYQNVRAYADKGGRIFGSHWHNDWIRTDADTVSDPLWYPQVVKFSSGAHGFTDPFTAQIDVSFPKGMSFRDWLTNVGASTTPGQIVIQGAEHSIDSVLPKALMDPAVPTYAAGPGAQQWIYGTDTTLSTPTPTVQYFSMNTPVAGAECGRMVFSDLHVSTGSGDTTKVPFPTGCSSSPLTPQEKALEFMLFDLSSCVQSDQDPPVPPVVVK